jgi:hypothetical protein
LWNSYYGRYFAMAAGFDNQNHVYAIFCMGELGTLKIRSEVLAKQRCDKERAFTLTFVPVKVTSKTKEVVVYLNIEGEFEFEELSGGSRGDSSDQSYDGVGIA